MTSYDPAETAFLVNGFRQGFDLGYRGPMQRRDTSNNIPFTVGDKFVLWEKVMKEVKLKRFAGPFKYEQIPFRYFVQSPIGLVPKKGDQTRLIFHLSYDFKSGNKSVNHHTPDHLCSIKYHDLDHAVLNSLKLLKDRGNGTLFYSKTDLQSAFRVVPIRPQQFYLLFMMAHHPVTGEKLYFHDKNMPFGGSISCSHFQRLSNGLKHVLETMTGRYHQVTNYLDDFLFIEMTKERCNAMVREFLNICSEISFPVATEKTEWAAARVVFLGILLDGETHTLSVPESKRCQALNQLGCFIDKRKATVRQLQSLAGTLNFLCKAIFPGRIFARRMYAKFSFKTELNNGNNRKGKGIVLKPHHHVRLDEEFRSDCTVWKIFLNNVNAVCRPMIDLQSSEETSHTLNFYTDASLNSRLGFGCYFFPAWTFCNWEPGWIHQARPSVAFVELYALCVGIFAWESRLQNMRITVFCDNKSVRDMVNANSSKCKHCVYLLRLLTVNNLRFNRRVFVRYVETKKNFFADSLSRLKINLFLSKAKEGLDASPTSLPPSLWPLSKIWDASC